MAKKKQIEVIDMGGVKTVEKKKSVVKTTKAVFAIVTVLWFAFLIWFPLYVKNTYSTPIKQSLVVSVFFDVQRSISAQYEKMLEGLKKSINLEKPVGVAIDKIKIAEKATGKVSNATNKAKQATDAANKLGAKTGLAKVVSRTNNAFDRVEAGIDSVDDVTATINKKLDSVKTELVKVTQTEVDKTIDEAIKQQLDKNTGGLGTTLLTNYGVKHVYPWRPSSWPVAAKIYKDLEKSNVTAINVLTQTVNRYFNLAAWGAIALLWVVGLLIWLVVRKRVKLFTSPFIVCPRCGHTFSDRRTAMGLMRAFQPWKWF